MSEQLPKTNTAEETNPDLLGENQQDESLRSAEVSAVDNGDDTVEMPVVQEPKRIRPSDYENAAFLADAWSNVPSSQALRDRNATPEDLAAFSAKASAIIDAGLVGKKPEAAPNEPQEEKSAEAPAAPTPRKGRGRRGGTAPLPAAPQVTQGGWVGDPKGERLRRPSTGEQVTNVATGSAEPETPARTSKPEAAPENQSAEAPAAPAEPETAAPAPSAETSTEPKAAEKSFDEIKLTFAQRVAYEEKRRDSGTDEPIETWLPKQLALEEAERAAKAAELPKETPKPRRRHAGNPRGLLAAALAPSAPAAPAVPESTSAESTEEGEEGNTATTTPEQDNPRTRTGRRIGGFIMKLRGIKNHAATRALDVAERASDAHEERRDSRADRPDRVTRMQNRWNKRVEAGNVSLDDLLPEQPLTDEEKRHLPSTRRRIGRIAAGLAMAGALFGGLAHADSNENAPAQHRQPAATAEFGVEAPQERAVELPNLADSIREQADAQARAAEKKGNSESDKTAETVTVNNDEVEIKLNKGDTFWEGVQEAEHKLGIDDSDTATANAINTIGFANGEDRTQAVGSQITFKLVDGKLVAQK